MKKTKTISIPEKRDTYDEYFCDICEKNLEEQWHGYEHEEGKIIAEWGESYPEVSFKNELRLDFCFDCMRDKIIPLIEKTFNIKAYETSDSTG